MLAVDHGYGRSPVTLTADQPVAQTVIGLERALALRFEFLDDGDLALLRAHAVEFAGIHHHAVFGVRQTVVRAVRALHHALDGEPQLLCEHIVALVVRRDAHDRARAVACQHVVRDEYGHFPAVDGVDSIRARHDARLFAVAGKTVDLRDLGRVVLVLFHRSLALRSRDDVHKRIFGREHDVRHAERRIRARREHAEFLLSALHRELYLAAVGLADPVFLHEFGLFRPVQLVEIPQQLVGVVRDLEEPLRQVLSHHRRTAAFALALHHLLVGEHRVAGRTPVDGRGFAVCQPVLVKLQEEPLRPLIVFGHAGVHFVVPVVHRAYLPQLFLHGGDVLHGAVLGMDARLYGVILGRQTESVEAHGLEHLIPLHPLETRIGIRRTVVVPVPRMKFRAGRIGKHFQNVTFLVHSAAVELVKSRIRPDLLPLLFDLSEIHTFSLKTFFSLIRKRILVKRII